MLFASSFSLNLFFNKQFLEPTPNNTSITNGSSFLEKEKLSPSIEAILKPFIRQFNLSQINSISIIESLRVYAALSEVSTKNELDTLLVFIVAAKYDDQWLSTMCDGLLYPEHETEKNNSAIFFCKKLNTGYTKILENNKPLVKMFYQLSGKDLHQYSHNQ